MVRALPPACPARVAGGALLTLLVVLASGCASARGSLPVMSGPAFRGTGASVAAEARTYAGTAYRSGGTSPAGFDCSGFVQYLFAQLGVALPRTAEQQYEVGLNVRERAIAPGDLVFFRTAGRSISHVGVATGDGTFIHAPNARSRVRLDRLDGAYWADRFAGARRIVEP